jgi:hypothetical protein
VFEIIKIFIYACVLVLLWQTFHLDPNTAQLKDFLLMLHDEQVHGHVAVLALCLLVFGDGLSSAVRSSTRCFGASSDLHGFGGPVKKESVTQATAVPK